jgi:glutamine synthetase type III
MADINAAANEAMRLVEQWRALETVGKCLSELAGLDGHRAELIIDIARLQSAQSSEQLKCATAEADAREKIATLKKETAEAQAELKAALDKHDAFLADAETQRVAKIQEQTRMDRALAETKDRMKQLAKTAE